MRPRAGSQGPRGVPSGIVDVSEELVESRDDGVGFGFIVGGVKNV